MTRITTMFLIVLFVPSLSIAATIHIPTDYATIQAGIDAAGDGDTVLVAPGTYTENIIFKGKVITVKSSHGPEVTVIDGNEVWHVVMFNQNEGPDTVLEGFTLTNGDHSKGAGIYCKDSASPSIIGNIITNNSAGEGGGIFCIHANPIIFGNTISANTATSGGAIYCDNAEPTILNNVFVDNATTARGGAIYSFISSPEIINNTFIGNTAASGGGGAIYGGGGNPTVTNNIFWGDSPDEISSASATVTYSCVQGGWQGEGNIDEDPLFVTGPHGDYYLSQIAAGQAEDSPCVDTGDPASEMLWGTTRTDHYLDASVVDMGYHCPQTTVSPELTCLPSSGTLPFETTMTVSLANMYTEFGRRFAGHIDLMTAGGITMTNWKSGLVNVGPGGSVSTSFTQVLPAYPTVIGTNSFTLIAEDVTPAPYNQPPYPPSGDTDTAGCTVTGIAP